MQKWIKYENEKPFCKWSMQKDVLIPSYDGINILELILKRKNTSENVLSNEQNWRGKTKLTAYLILAMRQ